MKSDTLACGIVRTVAPLQTTVPAVAGLARQPFKVLVRAIAGDMRAYSAIKLAVDVNLVVDNRMSLQPPYWEPSLAKGLPPVAGAFFVNAETLCSRAKYLAG